MSNSLQQMEQEEQKADLAQLESIAGKAFSDKSIKVPTLFFGPKIQIAFRN